MNNNELLKLDSDVREIGDIINQYEAKLGEIEGEVLKMLPNGYWWACDIDYNTCKPKKYSIKGVIAKKGGVYVTVKEAFKKAPWKGYDGKHYYPLTRFLNLRRYETEQEAMDVYLNRICPKCGESMMYSEETWCKSCIDTRWKLKKEFDDSHHFYNPSDGHFYSVEYEDELTRTRGYNGKHFTFKRMDTGEIVNTSNLWAWGRGENKNNLPEIEFLSSGY